MHTRRLRSPDAPHRKGANDEQAAADDGEDDPRARGREKRERKLEKKHAAALERKAKADGVLPGGDEPRRAVAY